MKGVPFKYTELLLDCGGMSFDNGLYTIHTFEDSIKWTNLLSKYFAKSQDSFLSFGHDWMGIQYCVSRNTNECIYIYDPATHEEFLVDENLLDFHNTVLPNSKEDNLASDLFSEALKYLKIERIDYKDCLGFKVPLFLNGKEEVSNYEICDIEFYWDNQFQIYNQIKDFPDGTHINNTTLIPGFKFGNEK
jgi:hypothetical protein